MFLNFFKRSPQIPRLYADFNSNAGREYWDYTNFKPTWGDIKKYEVVSELGSGKFSTVSKVQSLEDGQFYTMKQLKPLNVNRIAKYNREIKVLQNLKGGPNIPRIHDQIWNEDGTATLILEFIDAEPFRKISPSLNDFEVRYYFYEILKALDYSHAHGIMHRDVKPGNICINHEARKLRLIDWGLAEFYQPGGKQNLRVSTLHYKAPELLAQCPLYHYSIDSWSLGATLAGLIFRKDPFFYGKDLIDQLVTLVEFCGTEAFFAYVKRHSLELPEQLKGLIAYEPRKDLRMYISRDNHDLVSNDVLDLLSKLLVMDHSDRILAAEAMEHRYFDPVKEFNRKVLSGSLDVPRDSLDTALILTRSLNA